MQFLEKIKAELKPDKDILAEIDGIVGEINLQLKSNNIAAVCVPGGSVAKGTFLKGDFDVDLFVKFDYKYTEENISELLGITLKKFKPELLHGSRDYFQIKNKIVYEVVPVLDIKDPEKAQNVTDMSPLHVAWVKNRLKPGQADEIRLTKKFCKAQRLYGAESYISGFSGHVVDILIIKYGNFINLLRESARWKPKLIIDLENHFKTPRDILFELNQSKITGPMIVIDPILKTRNAASALSYEKFSLFKKRAQEFLKNPSEKFFREKRITKSDLKRIYPNLVIMTIRPESGKKDVVGSRIVKAYKNVKSALKDFKVVNSGWEWNSKGLLWYSLGQTKLPEQKIVEGPPLDKTEHVKNFKNKYENVFEEKGRLYAKHKIMKRDVESVVDELTFPKLKIVKTEKYF